MIGGIFYAVNLAAMTNEISAVIEENSLLQDANQELRAEVETLTEDTATARARLDKAIAEIAKMKSEFQNWLLNFKPTPSTTWKPSVFRLAALSGNS